MADRLEPVRIALAQIDTLVGDIEGNAQLVRDRTAEAREAGAELVLFPELTLTGYPPEDLLLKEHFLRAANEKLEELAAETEGIVAVVGFPERADDVYNALAVLAEGRIAAIYRKVLLPNYGVFDEQRYFQSGEGGAVLDFGDVRIGLTICEDIWTPGPPESDEALAGASLIVNISASPYHAGKGLERERMIIQRARDNLCAVAFCNLVGGQDELVFDGHSLVVDHEGTVIARGPQFGEGLVMANVDLQAAVTAARRSNVATTSPSANCGPRASTQPSWSMISEWPSKTSSSCPPTRLQKAMAQRLSRARWMIMRSRCRPLPAW